MHTYRYRIKKFARVTGGLSATLGLCIPALTFFMINQYTGRPSYKGERARQQEHNRLRLINEFQAQPVTFVTRDNLTLAGLLVERPHAKRVLLLCHGYRMCKERLIKFVEHFSHDTILLFDYRAHGQSEGTRTTIGFTEREDVRAALHFLLNDQRAKHLPIIGIGVSMGAVSLLGATALDPQVKALVLDSPFAQLDRQARKAFTYKYYVSGYPVEALAHRIYRYLLMCSLDQVDALCWARQVTVPTLIVHSEDDKVVPLADAHQLHAALSSEVKEFWQVSESGHARIFDEVPAYFNQIEHFLSTLGYAQG